MTFQQVLNIVNHGLSVHNIAVDLGKDIAANIGNGSIRISRRRR